VFLGSVHKNIGGWQNRLSQACGGLVHPGVAEPGERARQRRLLAASLTGPFLAAAAFAQVLTVPLGVSAALAAICLVFVVGWSAAVIVAQTGSRRIAGPLALVAAVFSCAAILYFAGGIASPLFLAWLPLIVETENVGRDRRFLLAGAIAAGTAVLLASMAGFLMPDLPAAGASAGHWLLPVIYAAMWFTRRSGERGSMRSETDAPDEDGIDGLLDAVTLRFAGNGELSDVSAQARLLLRLEPEFLLGTGLFDRVHVSDRVHYLNALADMREGADRRSLEVRVRLPRRSGWSLPAAARLAAASSVSCAPMTTWSGCARSWRRRLRAPRPTGRGSCPPSVMNCGRRSMRSSGFPTCSCRIWRVRSPMSASAIMSGLYRNRASICFRW
jgi:cell cycle sensor histidine kinase DivJ